MFLYPPLIVDEIEHAELQHPFSIVVNVPRELTKLLNPFKIFDLSPKTLFKHPLPIIVYANFELAPDRIFEQPAKITPLLVLPVFEKPFNIVTFADEGVITFNCPLSMDD